jgi:hypothetical protein
MAPVVLQLRTFAASGKHRAIVYLFIVTDIIIVVILVTMAVITDKDPQVVRTPSAVLLVVTGQSGGQKAYDSFMWIAIMPLEFVTLVVNAYLTWTTYQLQRADGTVFSQLMKTILRDNFCYLAAYVDTQVCPRPKPY